MWIYYELIWVRDLHRVSQQQDNYFNGKRRVLQRSQAGVKCYITLPSKKDSLLL